MSKRQSELTGLPVASESPCSGSEERPGRAPDVQGSAHLRDLRQYLTSAIIRTEWALDSANAGELDLIGHEVDYALMCLRTVEEMLPDR